MARGHVPRKNIHTQETGTHLVSNPNLSDSTPTNVLGNNRKSKISLTFTLIGAAVLYYYLFLRNR